MNVRSIPTMALLVAILVLPGCGADRGSGALGAVAPRVGASTAVAGTGGAPLVEVPFDPANFVARVDNPFFPLTRGTVLSYSDGTETDQLEVTRDTKNILGVAVTVVHDRVYVAGSLTEDTLDWYAQDGAGNVWYFGEDTKELDHGVVTSTEGSWEAGVNGAKAGIIMLAHPALGDTYYQENAPGVVADQGRVKGLNETATVPYGTFTGCVKTQEWTPLEPGNRAFKFYASGFGTVLEVPNRGEGPVELVAVTRP